MKLSFSDTRVFMGSVTNVANRPFRRHVYGLGARASLGEMVIANYAARGGKQDRALLKRDPVESCFGAQIVGSNEKTLVKTAIMAEYLGADFIDFNCACPHQSVIKHGGGALLLKRPQSIARCLEAIRQSVKLPITLKIRKGFEADDNVVEEIVDIAADCGVAAVFIHARTRAAQYRGDNDWDLIESVAANAKVPIIGCGDLAHGSQVIERLKTTHCAAVALARGALTKPWIFKEIADEVILDPSGEERLEGFKELVQFTLENFGTDERGLKNAKKFLTKQLDFLTRYIPTGAIGYEVDMQTRVDEWTPRDPLEALWARTDAEGYDSLLQLAGLPDIPSEYEQNLR